jgi:hypothetical protein
MHICVLHRIRGTQQCPMPDIILIFAARGDPARDYSQAAQHDP